MSKAFEVVQTTNKNTQTIIEFLLDETGSMSNARTATIDSFNEYISSQKSQPGECYLTLTKFDDRGIRTQYTDTNIQEVESLTEITYNPCGMTNLYDAVGVRIGALTAKEEKFKDAAKLIVIMTDGMDNCSTEYSASSLKSIIGEKEKQGWTFVFLGANQDAWQVGQQFGMAQGNTMTYSTGNMADAMNTLAKATTNYRSVRDSGLVMSTQASTDFFDKINTENK